MKPQDYKISSEKFVFHKTEGNLRDKKLETKPVTYFRDALNRFARNKASILAAVIIFMLILYAIIVPIVSPYTRSQRIVYPKVEERVMYSDMTYANVQPKIQLFRDLNLGFWDGGKVTKDGNQSFYDNFRAIEIETGREIIMSEIETFETEYMGKTKVTYSFRYDTYSSIGVELVNLTTTQYKALQEYQDRTGIQVIYPITDPELRPEANQDKNNGNIWYKTKKGKGEKTEIVFDKDGNFIPIYQAADGTDNYTSKMLWEGEEKRYNYAEKMDGEVWRVRVDAREYYIYRHSEVLGDKITEPLFIFGTDSTGKDLFSCLASGARFSFILAVLVASVNLFVGAIYGAIEGYYGGRIDIVMERIVEILSSIPFMIVISLLKYHLSVSHVIILFISFFLTGWTGMAGRTRMQFYRFKNQEYVLVARTLGARDRRIMFKHIFPNAIGTLITGSVLVIPGVIFSETSLSYLNIINLNSGNMTSVGTLLSNGQSCLFTFPHVILPPAIFISLLMLCFNLFGNGLRDAFNPSLRGTEE